MLRLYDFVFHRLMSIRPIRYVPNVGYVGISIANVLKTF